MSIWKPDEKEIKILLEVLAWTGLGDVTYMHCHGNMIDPKIRIWLLGDYGKNPGGEPFYAYNTFRSYFHRDSIAELS